MESKSPFANDLENKHNINIHLHASNFKVRMHEQGLKTLT